LYIVYKIISSFLGLVYLLKKPGMRVLKRMMK
jgi:hypothetical protein